MILERQIIPWREGRILETLATLTLVLFVVIGATRAAAPPPRILPESADCFRVASLNLHGGYTTFYDPNLEEAAELLKSSGASIILLQDVETGLLHSGSMDQVLWLAEKLKMNATFFAQNEDLKGLAILSRLDVGAEAGLLLTSPADQAAIQYVRYPLDQNGDLHIYNAWFSYPEQDENGNIISAQIQDQSVQLEEALAYITHNHFANRDQQNNDRIVFGGSFNFVEESPFYERLASSFEDPFITLFKENRDTLFRSDGVRARWDYIWLLNLQSSGVNIDQQSAISNHRMSVTAFGREANQGCPSNP